MASPRTQGPRIVIRPAARLARPAQVPKDVYMEKAQAAADPVIREALVRMVRAARYAFAAQSQLRAALRGLERHPDYLKMERGRGVTAAMTLAWWIHNCAHGALHDAPLEEAGNWLLVDADPKRAETNLRRFLEEDASDRARFARQEARTKGAVKQESRSGLVRPAAAPLTVDATSSDCQGRCASLGAL